MSANLRNAVLIGALLGTTACSTSTYSRKVSINPPEAILYIDGERVGSGDMQLKKFNFQKVKRHYVQAVHPDFNPELRTYSEEKIKEMIANNLHIRLTLMSRR